jgi:anti-anti-sigma factor
MGGVGDIPIEQVAPLTACRTEVLDGVSVVSVTGDLDLSTVEVLNDALAQGMAATTTGLTVDLSACSFLCSRSYGVLEEAARSLRTRGADLVVRGGPPSFSLIHGCFGGASTIVVA